MQETNIGWTDFSGQLIKYRDPDGNVVNACVKASEGCRNCYSETLAPRWGRKGRPFTAENMKRLTPFFDMNEARRVLGSKKIAGKRFFPNDMTDWMGRSWVPDELIDHCIALFALRPDVTFQTLTKHADRQFEYFSQNRYHEINAAAREITGRAQGAVLPTQSDGMVSGGLPLQNLHLGVSAEDQKNFDNRSECLLQTLAAVRWVSFEPLLGSIDASECLWPTAWHWDGSYDSPQSALLDGGYAEKKRQALVHANSRFLNWGVGGGESGAGHREMVLAHLTGLVDQFRPSGTPFYVKQDSGPRPGMQGRIPDDYWVHEFPA